MDLKINFSSGICEICGKLGSTKGKYEGSVKILWIGLRALRPSLRPLREI